MPGPRLAIVRKHATRTNAVEAGTLRQRFRQEGVFVASVVSAPGAGKTALFERTLADLEPAYSVEPLVKACDARMVERALDGRTLRGLEFLFVEHLVSPAGRDLGEDLRVAVLSVTEGEDQPLKYPDLFTRADVAVVTKMDLAEATGFDAAELNRNLQAIRPGLPVFTVSARTGAGMNTWVKFLETRRLQWSLQHRPITPARSLPPHLMVDGSRPIA